MARSFCTCASSKRRPMSRLVAKSVFFGLVTACRLAGVPTSFWPSSVKATIDGVVRAPSAFSITFAWPPSITATHEFVVPRSIPITSPTGAELSARTRLAAASWLVAGATSRLVAGAASRPAAGRESRANVDSMKIPEPLETRSRGSGVCEASA